MLAVGLQAFQSRKLGFELELNDTQRKQLATTLHQWLAPGGRLESVGWASGQPAVLPPYRRIILDEAHNLEDAATSHLGAQATRRGLLQVRAEALTDVNVHEGMSVFTLFGGLLGEGRHQGVEQLRRAMYEAKPELLLRDASVSGHVDVSR